MDDQPDDNPVDKGHAVVETVGYGMLPERLKKQIKKMEQQLRKEGIDTLTGLPVGMAQEEFDEKNRQFRMNKALAQSDGVNV